MMKIHRKKIFLLLILFFTLFFTSPAQAWDTNIAHPNIADLAVDIYNQNYSPKLTNEEKEWIKQGAKEEDTPLRWFNHFYDPIYDVGFKWIWDKASNWAANSNKQTDYALGDKSWQRALYNYKNNDKEQAFKALGHTLHLMADMSVPAHTRDDAHPSGDSLEQFVKHNWEQIKSQFKQIKITEPNDLKQAFLNAANFSNNNFYSDDTIENPKYGILKVDNYEIIKWENKNFFCFKNNYGKLFCENKISDWRNDKDTIKSLNNPAILSDYSTNLIPQAIGNSAGMIKLFFEETKNSAPAVPFFNISGKGILNQLAGALVVAVENLMEDNDKNQTASPVVLQNQNIQSNSTSINLAIFTAAPKIPTTSPTTTPSPVLKSTTSTSVIPKIILKPKISTSTITKNIYENLGVGHIDPLTQNNSSSSIVASTTTPQIDPTTTFTTSTADIIAPSVPAISLNNLSDYDLVNVEINLSSTDDRAGDLFFDLQYSNSENGPWISLASSTVLTNFLFLEGERGQIYYFRARAHDSARNYSLWSSEITANLAWTKISPPMGVVINEISIGKRADGAGGWLELYNNTDGEIDLNGWKILIDGNAITTTVKNAKILAHDYYLFERGENAVAERSADQIFSADFPLAGAFLQLVNASGTIIDEVDCATSTGGWFFTSSDGRSVERLNSHKNGSLKSNWRSSPAYPRLVNSISGSALSILGSPKISNFSPLQLNGVQTASYRYLSALEGPYLLDFYTVPLGKTLEVEGGSLFRATSKATLTVDGGTLRFFDGGVKTILTSGCDHDIPNYNFDYGNFSTSTPASANWTGLVLKNGATCVLNGVDMRYAGAPRYRGDGAGGWDYNGITLDSGDLFINNSKFLNNGPYTIKARSGNFAVSSSVFDGGGGAFRLENNNFLEIKNVELKNFTNTVGAGEIYNSTWPDAKDINLNSNAFDKINFSSVIINTNTIIKENNPFVINYLTVQASTTLEIEPGINFDFLSNGGATINGRLEARGTLENPINFRAFITSSPFNTILFKNTESSLENVVFSYGGYPSNGNRGMVTADNSILNFKNCVFYDHFTPNSSVYSKNSTLNFDGVSFFDATKHPWIPYSSYSYGVRGANSNFYIKDAVFENLNYGVGYNTRDGAIPYLRLQNPNFINVDYWVEFPNYDLITSTPPMAPLALEDSKTTEMGGTDENILNEEGGEVFEELLVPAE